MDGSATDKLDDYGVIKTNLATSNFVYCDDGGLGLTEMKFWHFEWKDAIKTNVATSKFVLHNSGGGGRTDIEDRNFE